MLDAKLASPEPGGGGGREHQPVGRVGSGHEQRDRQGRNEEERRADDGPVSAAELRHGERIGEPREGSDERPEDGDEVEELVGRIVETDLRQLGRRDAPYEPYREPQVLGDDGPNEVSPGDCPPAGRPEPLVLRVPPRRIHFVPLATFIGLLLRAKRPLQESASHRCSQGEPSRARSRAGRPARETIPSDTRAFSRQRGVALRFRLGFTRPARGRRIL